MLVFSPPLLNSGPSFENAIRLYTEGDISWQSSVSSGLPEFRFCDEPLDPFPPKPLFPLPEPSFIFSGVPPFQSERERIKYCLLETERGIPSQEMKNLLLSNYPLILEIVDEDIEQSSSVLLILENWYELGSSLISHLIRCHFNIYFDMLESLSLTWNRFRCYMSLVASSVLSIEDILPGMMTRLLMVENKEEAVRLGGLFDV